MGAFFSFVKLELGAAHDNFFLVLNIVTEHFFERQNTRHTIYQRQHNNTKANLKLRVLVELIKNNLRNNALLQVDNNINAASICAVVNVAYFCKLLIAHKLAQFLKQALAVYLIGNFFDNQLVAVVFDFLNLAFRTKRQRTAARFVRVADTFRTHNKRTGWKVRAR